MKNNGNGVNGNATKNKNKVNKKKKGAVKAVVDLPYSLNWPSFDKGVYKNIVSALSQSFNIYVDKLKNDMKLTEGDVDDDKPTSNIKNATKKLVVHAEPLCIVFGYNAVMRGLEKGKIKNVLVKSEAKPAFLTKAFIPICQMKNIPLIPIHNLSQNFEELISNKSTLAVGFTDFACKENGPFCELYEECCKAFGDESKRSHTDDGAKSNENSIKEQIQNSKIKVNANVNSYHLKRNSKTLRVFKPDKKVDDNSISFIKLKSPNEEKSVPEPQVSKKKKYEDFAVNPSECNFFIDMGSDAESEKEVEQNTESSSIASSIKSSNSRYFCDLDNSLEKNGSKKRKKKNYIPTKIKRIKGNPKRHS